MTTPDLATRKNRAGQPGPTPLGHPTPARAEPGADAWAQARIADLEAINRTLAEQLTAEREQHAMLERLVDAAQWCCSTPTGLCKRWTTSARTSRAFGAWSPAR